MYTAPVQIQTFVAAGGRHRPGSRFVAIEDVAGTLGAEHPEGFVRLQVGSRVLLDERHWDAIDLLWIELIEMCNCLSRGESYSFLFPDQPLEFAAEFEPRAGEVALSVGGERPVVTSRGEFLAAIVRAGLVAMEQMRRIMPRGGERYGRYVEELRGMAQASNDEI
jgi:hypothetical protein